MELDFVFVTDTATVVLFDPEAVKHRHEERADWWSNPFEELDELNAGNMVIFDLGADGEYITKIITETRIEPPAVCANFKCLGGTIMIGPGETLPGGGLGPSKFGGGILDLTPGNWQVAGRRLGAKNIELRLNPVSQAPTNSFDSPLSIDRPNKQ